MPDLMMTLTVMFQFHKGSIKTHGQDQGGHRLARFNSTKVRLRLLICYFIDVHLQSFNSTKVRLRRNKSQEAEKQL